MLRRRSPRSQGLLLGVEDNGGAGERLWSPTRSPPVLRGRGAPGPPGLQVVTSRGGFSALASVPRISSVAGEEIIPPTRGMCFSSRGIY